MTIRHTYTIKKWLGRAIDWLAISVLATGVASVFWREAWLPFGIAIVALFVAYVADSRVSL